ncbi:CBS domain-containing protein [Buchnera aphidicola]|uniref:CBS domain-containing protein n=1 Tax=Buchnera aphidicola TaxID=9 RepID=UPI00346460F7
MKKKNKKSFFSSLINQIFYNEPQDKEELLNIIKGAKRNKLIQNNTYYVIKNIINIENKKVKDIMIPRNKIIHLQTHDNIKKCLKVITKSPYSRFPVFSQDNSHLKGFLIAKDLIQFIKNKKEQFILKKNIKPPIIVPEGQRLDKILQEFYLKKIHIAIVVDEFGMITGIITIKDVLRKIFKNIKENINNTKKYQQEKINQEKNIKDEKKKENKLEIK